MGSSLDLKTQTCIYTHLRRTGASASFIAHSTQALKHIQEREGQTFITMIHINHKEDDATNEYYRIDLCEDAHFYILYLHLRTAVHFCH